MKQVTVWSWESPNGKISIEQKSREEGYILYLGHSPVGTYKDLVSAMEAAEEYLT